LALSLVLALLLVKPAPMYILDEIDSALDLSHTQNIGEMLKTHFTQSQFIIISLKEGMFNNANVLFKVKNVNGASQVTRIDTKKASKTKLTSGKSTFVPIGGNDDDSDDNENNVNNARETGRGRAQKRKRQ